MSSLNDLYQEVILDHNREPRNFGPLPGANRKAEGYNPLCGDRITVYLKFNQGRIEAISFQGSGCAISKASGSLMTSALKGKTKEETNLLYGKFHEMVTGKLTPGAGGAGRVADEVGKLAVFSGVCEFPARVKCATLAWHTLRAAIDGKDETVSTEMEGER